MLRNKQSLKTWKAEDFKSLAESKEVYKKTREACKPDFVLVIINLSSQALTLGETSSDGSIGDCSGAGSLPTSLKATLGSP